MSAAPDLARYIDHTLLAPAATADEIDRLCDEAVEHRFMAVCVNPTWVRRCAARLDGSDVRVCTVIGFPLGATTTATKVGEAVEVAELGATELDMVLNVGALRSGDRAAAGDDIAAVVAAGHGAGALVKVILETVLLTDDEKVSAARLAVAAGADFVKTSTGFGGGGATTHDVALLRETVGRDVGVKASGGVRSREAAQDMIVAGASRLGTSSGIAIVTDADAHDADY
ncbi:MAG: deoxyribose-phosphate aldolase [Actinomycetota bacterium]